MKNIILILFSALTINGCSDKLKSLNDTAIEVSSVNGEEISYSKIIESKESNYFVATGGFGDIRYLNIRASKNGVLLGKIDDEIEGMIYEVITGDINNNSKTELYILYLRDSYSRHANIAGFEFNGKIFNRFDLPELDEELKSGYEGKDLFFISNSKLVREFPLVNSENSKRRIEYSLTEKLNVKINKSENF